MIENFFKIKKRDKEEKLESEFSFLISSIKELKKETPQISLPDLYFAPKEQAVAQKDRSKTWLWKTVSFSLAFVFVLIVINSGILNTAQTKLSGLNQRAIAKELKIIETNSPTKSLEVDKKIKKLLSQKQASLKGLDREAINSEIKKIQKKKLQTEEINTLINNL